MTHLTNDILVRHLDDELLGAELLEADRHLESCEQCRWELASLRRAAGAVDNFFLSFQPMFEESERAELAQSLGAVAMPNRGNPNRVGGGSRWAWASGLAACVAAGVLYLSTSSVVFHRGAVRQMASSSAASPSSFEVDGEKFWALPYTSVDSPSTARVLQMEIPVTSLADAGIVVEPVLSRAAQPERAVLADVLLGVDGQPLGVHVINED